MDTPQRGFPFTHLPKDLPVQSRLCSRARLNDALLQPTAQARWRSLAAPLGIVLAALCYYGSYLSYWFNPHDEGGTGALTAMRLLAGETPIRDVELGYNVGWFLPIVALFKIGGVNFLLMRAYFFALSTITALCGWALVRRLTRNEWLAVGSGLMLVLFPGSQFKNYIPLLCVANMLCVVNAARAPVAGWRWRVLAGGLVLGFTLLIRIDLGCLFGLLWLGLLVLRLCDSRVPAGTRLRGSLAALALLCGMILATHTPMYFAARAGGYGERFVQQYVGWVRFLGGKTAAVLGKTNSPAAALKISGDAPKITDRSTLPRMDLRQALSFRDAENSVLFFLTYAPVLLYAVLLGWAAWFAVCGLRRRDFKLDDPSSLALLALTGSLAVFPQFFFFRPDRPHLSEFMPGYIVATVCATALIRARWRRVVAGVLVVQFGFFAWFALEHYSAGTIAARMKIKADKRAFFEGANGVRVWVSQKEHKELEGVRRAVVEHSKPGDWLVCYPYQPGYNVMTDRPTYERAIYNDNATTNSRWAAETIARMKEKQPAVIVIDDRAINKVEGSRFSTWAAAVNTHIEAHYKLCATFDTIKVFARETGPEQKQP